MNVSFVCALSFVLGGTPPVPKEYADALSPQSSAARWSAEQAKLGRRLFFDPLLSADKTVSCASCHQPAHAFADPRRFSEGVQGKQGGRNAPSVVNRALGQVQFWDGRAESLEAQALGPIQNPVEMNLPLDEAVRRLNQDPSYRQAFRRVFGGPPNPERLGKAIAAYERTIYSVNSPFSRFLEGDQKAMSEAARRGLALFGGKAQCSTCHSGINFTDEAFHALGVDNQEGRAAVTGKSEDKARYKTPTLRELVRTAPYMHDGSLTTLEDVVEYYDRGGTRHPSLPNELKALHLTAEEKADLVQFLKALTGEVVELADARP